MVDLETADLHVLVNYVSYLSGALTKWEKFSDEDLSHMVCQLRTLENVIERRFGVKVDL